MMSSRRNGSRLAIAMATGAAVAAALLASPGPARAQAAQTITVNGTSAGRVFDGEGALSAGASSRLLYDYPAKQQSQVLDYLFKPDYGASLQVLKTEIGGDTNSTDGDEPSHMRTPTDLNCNRGYEWWLMEQAKARNPAIKLYALEWGAPGWVGNGQNTVWTSQNITYLLNWLGCARQHGLQINYLGGWNEAGYNQAWYEQLRQALDANGYQNVQVVAADSFGWGVADSMASDPAFNSAVNDVSVHYPCGYLGGYTSCPSTSTAQGLGKPLWAGEQGSQPYDSGAIPLARSINRDYLDGQMTSTINWSLVWSGYQGLPFGGDGLMLANTPWSGDYTVGPSIWAMAHTAQFTQPGWHYLDSGSSYLNGGGSEVTLRAPTSGDWSSVIETTTATSPQELNYRISGGLSTGTVHVWATNMNSAKPSSWFQHVSDVTPQQGSFSLNLQPGYVYTLTTTTGQSKGSAASSGGASSLRLPYSENFDSYQPGVTPTYFASMGGAFETEPCIAGPAPAGPASSGMCLQQQITSQPVTWWGVDNKPMVVAGDPSWRDYRASIDALMERPGGYVELVGRALGPSNGLTGYHFQINTQGQWSLYREDSTGFDNPGADTTLASGTTTVFGEYTWHQLSIDVAGDQISPYLDGHLLTTVTDNTYQMGQVGLEVSPWLQAQFDNLQVQPEKVPSQDKAPQLSQPNSTAVQMPDPGASRQVGTTLAAPATATAVSARMQAPQGWSAEAVNSAPARLSAGQAAPLAWRLTAPANAARGLYQAEIIVTYESAGRSWTSTSRVPVYLGLQPSPALAHTPMKP